MEPQHDITDDEDDIHTITSMGYHSHNNISNSSGMMQASTESFRVNSTGSGCHNPMPNQIPMAFDSQQLPMRLQHCHSDALLRTRTSSPDIVYSNPDVVHNNNVTEDVDDDQTTATMEYALSMNSFYSHRDALSASGSYGADMSFVTTQTSSIASPPPVSSLSSQQQLLLPQPQEQALPRLQLHQVSDDNVPQEPTSPSICHNHMEVTQSAIKAAIERGANMAYDESSSVLGFSTIAHTIASSSYMTKDNNKYFFNSSFLRSHSYIEADAVVVEEDQRPTVLPHPPSLPLKNTDLTTDSMFLGMEYDNDYIKTKLKGETMATAHLPKQNIAELEETTRRIQRRRIICCVYSLIALILIVGIGGILCTFGTTCPGVEKLFSRSSSIATAEDRYDGTIVPTGTPVPLIRNTPTVNPSALPTTKPSMLPTGRPVVLKTHLPTKRPMLIVIPPPMMVVKESKAPTLLPTNMPHESDMNEDEAPSPTKENNNDGEVAPSDNSDTGKGNAPDASENEPEKEPTAAPTKEPNNDVKDDENDGPTTIPTNKPTISSPNDDEPANNNDDRDPEGMNDDAIPTLTPTFIVFRNDDDTNNMNTEDDDGNNNDDDRSSNP